MEELLFLFAGWIVVTDGDDYDETRVTWWDREPWIAWLEDWWWTERGPNGR